MNVDLLLRTLRRIEANPEEHDQNTWRCGTRMCFAGHAATAEGGIWFKNSQYLFARNSDPLNDVVSVVGTNGDRVQAIRAQDRARRMLGLSSGQADLLFLTCENAEELRIAVMGLIGGQSIPAIEGEIDRLRDEREEE